MMAYREKMSWLTLATMIIAYGVYFGLVGPSFQFGQNRLIDIVFGFGPVAAIHGSVVALISLVFWLQAGRSERQRPDERDRAIARQAGMIGYGILLVGLIWAGAVMPFYAERWVIINVALGFLVLAEVSRDTFILFSYRRGWHG